jgi:hypothetical protein
MNAKLQSHSTRFLAAVIIVVSIITSLVTAPALAASSPVGTWAVAGNMNVVAKFPGIISSTTALNAKTLGMQVTYGEDKSFGSSLLGLSGTWEQTGNKVNIDLTQWIDGLKATVLSILPENTVIDVSRSSFTARIVSDKKMIGKIKLIINAVVPAGSTLGGTTLGKDVRGRITISGALSNTPALPAASGARASGAGTGDTRPIDILNRIIGSAFFFQLLTR